MNIIVTGAEGMLGRAVVRALAMRVGIPMSVVALGHQALDIRSSADVAALITKDDLVINCAGVVPGAEQSAEEMVMTNTEGPRLLAEHASRVVQVSTDCVFDGQKGSYSETSKPSPQRGNYAVTKLSGEVTWAPHLTVRASFIGFGKRGLLAWLLRHPQGAEVSGYVTWLWNGFYAGTFARHLVDVALSQRVGLLHLHAYRPLTKYKLLHRIAEAVRPDLHIKAEWPPRRIMVLASSVLPSDDPLLMSDWGQMLEELIRDYRDGAGRS